MIAIHGDKQQNERDWVLNEFKTGKSPIMVATDVASRGIGMIDAAMAPLPPLPFPPQRCSRVAWYGAVLSMLVLPTSMQTVSGLSASIGPRVRVLLDHERSRSCFANLPFLYVPQG